MDLHERVAAEAATPAPARTRIVLLAILLLGALLRGLYLAELAHEPETFAPSLDAAFHDHWARALATGDWSPPRFFPDPGIQSAPYFRPPAYPYFLAAVHALTGGEPIAIRAVQMLLGLSSVCLAFLLGRLLWGSTVGLLTAAGMATTWSLVYFEGELLAPPLLVVLLLAALLCWHRWWRRGGFGWAFAGGAVLGLLALGVPNALAVAPVVGAWGLWLVRRKAAPGRFRDVLLALPLGWALAIAPATLRNLAVAGEFVLVTSNGGVNLYIGNNAQADGCTARIPILAELAPLQGWTCFDQPAIVRGAARLAGRPLTAGETSRWFAGQAVAFVAAEPGTALALAARKAALFWGPAEVSNNREDAIVRTESAVLRWLPTFPWVLSFAVVGAAMVWRQRRERGGEFALLLAAIVLVFFATHLPFFVAGRYRVPLLPILWLFGAFGIAGLAARVRALGWRAAAPWLAGWLALLAASHVELTGYRPDRSMWHFQRGDAWRMLGDLDASIAEFRRAVAANPASALAHNNLGASLLRRGRFTEAQASLHEAVRLDPAYVDARANLALALAAKGDDAGAVAQLAVAVQRAPDRAPLRAQLGALLLRLGRSEAAVPHLEAAAGLVPDEPKPRYLLALAQLESGRAAAGQANLEALLRAAPRFVDAYVALADLFVQRGLPDRARELVDRALALEPDHVGAKELQSRLR